MARLLVAQQIARAANIQIMAGELEAGAQGFQRGQNLQALVRLRRHGTVGGHREEREGAGLGTAHAPAQLIERGQAKHIGAMHDERIRGGNVEAGFDDRGGDENVVFALIEGRHFLFQLRRRHLPVGHDEFRLGHRGAQKGGGLLQILDARAHIERLTAAIAFAQQGLAHDELIEGRDEGAHRQTIHRRCRDDGKFAHAGHGELHGAGNGRG